MYAGLAAPKTGIALQADRKGSTYDGFGIQDASAQQMASAGSGHGVVTNWQFHPARINSLPAPSNTPVVGCFMIGDYHVGRFGGPLGCIGGFFNRS